VTRDLTAIRARAREHQDQLDEPRWLTTAAVAARFGVSESTIRGIPADELPYKEFGNGHKLKRRRYRVADVEAYEKVDVRHTSRRAS
jgi:hypothetical protein